MKKILDNHRSLMLLDEIAKGDDLTQRDLSTRLDMAVGLVNTYLKTLVKKGHIKISGIPPKRLKYYLTPKGFIEKSNLTYRLLQNYTLMFNEARRDFSQLFQTLQESGIKRICFAGVDETAEIAYLSLKETDMEFVCAFDDELAGKPFFKTTVSSFDQITGAGPDDHFVVTSFRSRNAVYKKLQGARVDKGNIHSIYPLARCGENLRK
jgi:DNA-binding MarR family transcriptional regulator